VPEVWEETIMAYVDEFERGVVAGLIISFFALIFVAAIEVNSGTNLPFYASIAVDGAVIGIVAVIIVMG
jgi:hypothetical protein